MWLKSLLTSVLTTATLSAPAWAGAPLTNEAAQANNDFGWSLFEQLQAPQVRTENLLFSPLSAWLALSLASNGTEQETLEEIQNALRTDEYSLVQTNPLVRDLVQNLMNNEGSSEILRIANAVWVNSDSFDLAAKFQTDAETFYSILPDDEVVTSESFGEAATIQHINEWVSKSTGGMIPSILQKLDPDMASILLNALYFQGQWLLPFSTELTSSDSFQLADGSTKTVSMMQQRAFLLPFASSGQYKMITLAFRSGALESGEGIMGRFQLDLVLPEGAEGSIFNLKQADYQSLVQGLSEQVAHVALPKFKFSFEKSLTDSLQAIGIQRAFDPGLAQMAPLGTPKMGGRAYISDVLQKTAVEMDEHGFKAAAVTAVIVGTTGEPVETAEFVADRPFFFALRDRITGALLFQGIVANPEAP
ncbi:serpin family protein [Oligoflexus tunisiensis]|uniref:serpin family protein n=1 Tax=Oligoflexus tunisiensis TaxID=708132 RepID=UPI00114CAEB3|nr:serpin family protein [Oligoflexus tunisiensis]